MKPARVERRADRPNAAVHHVGGRDDVAARLGLDHRLPHQHFDRLVVEDHAVAQQPVMAVAGVGIERNIAKNANLRYLLLDGADRATDQIVRVERLAPVLVAPFWVGIWKQRQAGDRELRGALGFAHRLIDRKPFDARHGVDRHARTRPIDQEQRPDQVVGGERVLADQPPRPFGLAVAARAHGKIEAGSALDAWPRPGQAGFDRPAVFDGHYGAPG